MARRPRIALAVVCGAMCLALSAACFALQYRSANVELVRRGGPGPTVVEIYEGKLSLSWVPRAAYRPVWAGQIDLLGFRYNVYSNGSWYVWGPLSVVGVLIAAVVAPLAALPWMHFRFSLRTVLIAITLFAIVLGLAMAIR